MVPTLQRSLRDFALHNIFVHYYYRCDCWASRQSRVLYRNESSIAIYFPIETLKHLGLPTGICLWEEVVWIKMFCEGFRAPPPHTITAKGVTQGLRERILTTSVPYYHLLTTSAYH